MWKTLAFKEARDNVWLGAAALALLLFVVVSQTGWDEGLLGNYGFRALGTGSSEIPFMGDDFTSPATAVAAFLAVALGFHQTLGEALHGRRKRDRFAYVSAVSGPKVFRGRWSARRVDSNPN